MKIMEWAAKLTSLLGDRDRLGQKSCKSCVSCLILNCPIFSMASLRLSNAHTTDIAESPRADDFKSF
jgi:hypothetical protein